MHIFNLVTHLLQFMVTYYNTRTQFEYYIKYNQTNIIIKLFPVYRRISVHGAGDKRCYAVEEYGVFSAIQKKSNGDVSYLLNIFIY